ncbi:11540_t:CDS:2 [Diversispora eburnea]|uniref:11540_t:CDS:1 n=1 Tax=Diversispora eburnea TaxID=1213867 RepID=A0A9N9F0A2_9GLOM|nr:11540_t:CDS:2 [Diversispora eburnea]
MQFLNADVLREIFLKLADTNDLTGEYSSIGLRDLYPCIFVCRQWCSVAMPILWGRPFHFLRFSEDEPIPRTSDKILEISLSYINLCLAVIEWCNDLENIMRQKYGEESELTEEAEYLILHTILKLCFNKGARLSSLNILIYDFIFSDNDKDDKKTLALTKCFVDKELEEFFASIHSLEFNVMFKVTNDLISMLSRICHKLNHVYVHTLWSRRPDTQIVTEFGESFTALVSAQKNLSSFHLSKCKGYTHVFLPALSKCTKTLRHMKFEEVDFKDCKPWFTIAECNNLVSLQVIQCSNTNFEMIEPVINTTFMNISEALYYGDGICNEFMEWADGINNKIRDRICEM